MKINLRLLGCGIATLAILFASCDGENAVAPVTQGTGAAPTSKRLSTVFTPQRTQVWCWAATTSEVLAYFGFPWDQCQLVSYAVAGNTFSCCPLVVGGPCLTPGGTSQMAALLSVGSNGAVAAQYVPSPISFEQVQAAINANRPMILFYSDFATTGHVVVLYGYDAATGEVYIHDPFFGPFVVPYAATFTYAGSKAWFGTMTAARAF